MTINPTETRELGSQGENSDLKAAFDILHYLQNLIQLADSKANNLIVINSIFLASVTSFIMGAKETGTTHGGMGIFHLSFLVVCVMAIYFCLRIIMTKAYPTDQIRHKDLIFFGDIVQRNSPENYIFEFSKIKSKDFLQDVLRRNYVSAHIAHSKYHFTKIAQNCTVISATMWLLSILVMFLH
jgi:hypothetical protein